MATYHITFGTYGARLHGGARPTVDRKHNRFGDPFVPRNERLERYERSIMRSDACKFTDEQREFVQKLIPELCVRGGWTLHSCACEIDHVHVLLSASAESNKVRKILKTWITQALNEAYGKHDWLAVGGSCKVVFDDSYYNNTVRYIENQRYQAPDFRESVERELRTPCEGPRTEFAAPSSPLAGKPAPKSILVDLAALDRAYYGVRPDLSVPSQQVSFGTSGHRGTSLDGSFTESHILAICQAVCDFRTSNGFTGPLFLGKDTHYLSGPAQKTAIEVFAANNVKLVVQSDDAFTPTPVISWLILRHNHGRTNAFADGVVITPSHNPPADGGIKYNGPNGGPADTDYTGKIQTLANEHLREGLSRVQRLPYERAMVSGQVETMDFKVDYIADLEHIIDLKLIAEAKLKIGVDPLGGAGGAYWEPIAAKYGLDITVVNQSVDPTFSFMTVDHDGKIRMDCSSPYAMQGLIGLKDRFDLAFANDPDTDRHGIVVPSVGLMNPNHYIAVAVEYLFSHRPDWPIGLGVGKTLVSSGIIDRVAKNLGLNLVEVPVGFKWFVKGLYQGSIGFGGEESAGASFLRKKGTVWSTDKDGIIMNLLAAEMIARSRLAGKGQDPGELYRRIEERFGKSYYTRIDQPTTVEQKSAFKNLTPDKVISLELAGDRIETKLTQAPGNGASIGGLKITTAQGWFAARPSGTENIYKIYAESFRSEEHLARIVEEARTIVDTGTRK